jgi:predicted kinase
VREPLLFLFWFDIAARVSGVPVIFLWCQSIPEGLDALAKFTGDPADATRSKKKQDNDENNDPFGAM